MSIKAKLTILFLAVASIPLLLVTALIHINYKHSLEDGRLAQMQDLAAFKADKIETHFASLKIYFELAQAAQVIKKNLSVMIRLAGDPDHPEFRAAREMIDAVYGKLPASLYLLDLMLTDPQGRIVYSGNPEHFAQDLLHFLPDPQQKAFPEGKDKIYFSDIFFNKAHNDRPGMLITGPVRDFDGNFIGVIAAEVDMIPVYNLVQDTTGLGRTGETLLGKKIGEEAVFLNPLRHDPGATLVRKIKLGTELGLAMQQAVQKQAGVGQYLDYRGEKVVAAWRYLPSMDWGMVAKIDSKEAFAGVTRLRHLAAIILAIVMVLSWIIAYSIARSISEPIRHLAQGAEIIGSGNLGHKVAINQMDEIGQLSQAFDKMTGDLQRILASRDELNQEIAERRQAEEALLQSEQQVRRKLESVLSPEGDLGILDLADLVDIPALQSLMENYYQVTRIPMSILDEKGKVLVGVGWQEICTRFHRANPQSCRHCLESDLQLTADLRMGEIRLYQCKNHMWDIATPLLVAGQRLGGIFSGQFFFENETPDIEIFRAQARQFGFDEKEYLAALDRVPRLSRETVNHGMSFFLKLADMLSQLGYSNVKLARLLAERDALTESLRQSELFYRQTLDSIPGMVFTTRPDGYCDYQSQPWVDFTGVPMSEHLGNGWNKLLHPDDRPHAFAAWRDAVEERAAYDLEYRVRRYDGEYQWFKVIGRPIRDDAGRIVRWFGVAANIHEIIRSEEVIRKAAAQFEILSDTAAKLLESKNPQQIINSLCERVMAHLDCHIFVNYLVEEEARRLHLNACGGLPEKMAADIEWLDFGQAICGRVAAEGQRIVAENIQESCDARADLVRSVGIRAYACHPILAQGQVIGTLSFGTRSRKSFSADDLALMKTVTDHVATAMERLRAEEALRLSRDELEIRVEERTRELTEEVAERKKAENSIKAERQRFYDVLETLPAYVCLLMPDYYMPFANRIFRQWFGYQPDKKCYEFLFNRQEPCENCETYKVLQTHQPQQWEWTGPNGRNYSIYDFPFTDTDGSQLILEMGMDITEQKQAQTALRSASLYTRGLLEASLDPLVTISPAGKITDVNQATETVTGLSREHLIGSDFSHYFTDPDKARDGYQKVLAEGLVKDYPLTIRHTEGRTTDVLYHATVYKNEAGEVHGVFAAARDITEKKAVEAELARYRLHLEYLVRQRTGELARSNKDLEQFAYVASHDLQEPLRAVAGFVELLRRNLKGTLDDKTTEYMNFTIDGARRMQTLISGLLEYSRIGTQGKAPQKTDSKAALDEAITRLQTSIKETGAEIIADGLPTVYFDSVQLSQLFQNLIGNALKFRSEKAPRIHIIATRHADGWQFAVADNGIGFEPQYAERIFQIFQRLHSRENYPGTGIGLSICKKIVERHNGKIWVDSKPAGGSIFYFTVPDKGESNE